MSDLTLEQVIFAKTCAFARLNVRKAVAENNTNDVLIWSRAFSNSFVGLMDSTKLSLLKAQAIVDTFTAEVEALDVA